MYNRDADNSYLADVFVRGNAFRAMEYSPGTIPEYEKIKGLLPEPVCDSESVKKCYYKAWDIAFGNIKSPSPESGLPKNFIDTAFNDCIFIWDTSFMMMFTKYAEHIVDFKGTLDDFYSKQHKDGFIYRQISYKDGSDRFMRFAPHSTGPELLSFAEAELFKATGDKERLKSVFFPLFSYRRWMRLNRTWRDGLYWSSGLGCGMDNQPRLMKSYPDSDIINGNMAWIDASCQALLSLENLLYIVSIIGGSNDEKPLDGIADYSILLNNPKWEYVLEFSRDLTWGGVKNELLDEYESLKKAINAKLWDDKTGFYYDLYPNDELSKVKSIAAFWALISGAADGARAKALCAHLNNENEFSRPHSVPTLSFDNEEYDENGGYWFGGVWSPTEYMVFKGLYKAGEFSLAYRIADNHLKNIVKVFETTGTLIENYAPESAAQGKPAIADFVGWTGVSAI